jgi:asparagine synthase (glutamine-hydrolysing)
MCGLVGIVARGASIPPGVLERATLSLAHRGPDDSGTVLLRVNHTKPMEIGLGHRRLSILDLSSSGHQPMRDPATGNWIVYNGEIYNFRRLREELEALGAQFTSQSDTEVILAAYRVWGDSSLARLDGMFALALWDASRTQLILARDAMGIKPLYYWQSAGAFVFASEIRTLLATGLVPRKVDPIAVWSYLAFGSVCEPYTMIEGVSTVPPGHALTVKDGVVSAREYWTPRHHSASSELQPSSEEILGEGRMEEQLPAVLRDAVLSQLVSDVPVGVFLSGGIDSSALVAILSHNGVRASTFSLVFQEEEFDEGQYSRVVARRFATDHQEIPVSEQDALAELPGAVAAIDQPTIDGVNTFLVSAKTRSAGVKVALTGLGADEIFAGYSNFRRVPRMERFARSLGRLPGFARHSVVASLGRLARTSDRRRKLAILAAGGDAGADPEAQPYFLARSLFSVAEREQLLASDVQASQKALGQVLRSLVAAGQSLDPVNRVAQLESSFYMRNTLLRDADAMSMAHGLELRVPFLDRKLVELCFRIPGSRKLAGRSPKGLLLRSLGVELPSEIVNRTKRGFTLPFERWLRGEMRSVVEDKLMKSDWDQAMIDGAAARDVWSRFLARETSWSRPWSLFVLKSWCQRNL